MCAIPKSKRLASIPFIGLSLLVSLSDACKSAHSAPTDTTPTSGIKSLFSVEQPESIAYPPIDVAGPQPRRKWVEAYECAMQAGLIPAIPKSKIVNDLPVYPASHHGVICNPGLNHCNLTGDVLSAPAGMAGISFDDGPHAHSLELLDYLKSHSQKATHFLIGSRIMSNLSIFRALDAAGEHLAVHTYSHPMMTSLTDHEILGEIGWAMQVIHDFSSHQAIARHWRPPYGDLDPRVDAIARHVFGLRTILWQFDPRDWCLADSVPRGSACSLRNGPQSLVDLKKGLDLFVKSNKQDGLLILEHETSGRTIEAFKSALPLMKKLHWVTKAIPDLFGEKWYQ